MLANAQVAAEGNPAWRTLLTHEQAALEAARCAGSCICAVLSPPCRRACSHHPPTPRSCLLCMAHARVLHGCLPQPALSSWSSGDCTCVLAQPTGMQAREPRSWGVWLA